MLLICGFGFWMVEMASAVVISDTQPWKDLKVNLCSVGFSFVWCFILMWSGYPHIVRLMLMRLRRLICGSWWPTRRDASRWWCMIVEWKYKTMLFYFLAFLLEMGKYAWCFDFCKFGMNSEFDSILLDYSRQCATLDTWKKLQSLAEVGL